MFKNMAAIPSIVGHRRIILLGRTTLHNVTSQNKLKISQDVPTMLCDYRATSCNGRAMVVC